MIVNCEPKRINIKGYNKDDCSINALGSALGISYDLARKVLQTSVYMEKGKISFFKKNPRTKSKFSSKGNIIQVLESISEDRAIFISKEQKLEELNRTGSPHHLGTEDNNVNKFAQSNPNGVFILLVNKHLLTVIDGKIIDTWDSSKLAVEVAYRIDRKKARKTIADLAKFYKMNNEEHYDSLFNVS